MLKKNERTNRALKGAQPVFGLLSAVGVYATISCLKGIPRYNAWETSFHNNDDFIFILAAGGTALCAYLWKQILKKRMEFSNHEKELVPFFIMDLFERIASIKIGFNLGKAKVTYSPGA